LLQFFQTRVLRGEESDLRIADLSGTIEVAQALEMSDKFLELPLAVRCTYSRAPVNTRGNGLAVLARWGERHATDGVVEGVELTSGAAAYDRLLIHEDRSRLATLYLWLAQRFPDVYVNGAAVMRTRERIDEDIHSALLQQGDHSKRDRKLHPQSPARKAMQPFRRKGPPKFNPRRLRK
jgi:ATP-dependent RNA helicase SUPV3L1/SUV3